MTIAARTCALSVATLTLLVGVACSVSPARSVQSGAASATPSSSPLAAPRGSLAAQVPMPLGFPSDFPIYPGARLTVAGGFTTGGSTTWAMTWQTLDAPAGVHAFFAARLNTGDWTITASSAITAGFTATFRRRSDPNVNGTLTVTSSLGVTATTLVLTTAP